SIYGYQPQADVMAVAESFTVGPYQFHQTANSMPPAPATGTSGYFGAPGVGPIKGLILRVKAKLAARNAARLMAVTRGMNGLGSAAPFGPAIMLGPMVVPSDSGRVQALVQMATARMPDAMANPVGASVMNNWNNLRWGRP